MEEISVSLGDNIASDKLTLVWNSTSSQCSSETSHIVVNSCRVTDANGITADAYDQNLVLNIDMTPQWTLPDLGDTRREPVVRILTEREIMARPISHRIGGDFPLRWLFLVTISLG